MIAGKLQQGQPYQDLRPLSEGVAPNPIPFVKDIYTDTYTDAELEVLGARDIRHYAHPAGDSSKDDPLGYMGYVSMKYWYGPNQYGNWIKLSSDEWSEEIEYYAKQQLNANEGLRLKLLNKYYPEYAPQLWQGNEFLPARVWHREKVALLQAA